MYVKCFDFVPYFWNEADGIKKSEDYKPYVLQSTVDANCATAMINSSTFFLYFILLGDGFHCGKEFVHSFPAGLEQLSSEARDSLQEQKRLLMKDMKNHAVRRVAQSKKTGRVEYYEFWPRHSKHILDKIDQVLARHYGFSDEELDFIINYDIKYRMGAEQA